MTLESELHFELNRYYVKIEGGKAAGGNPCIYHKTDMRFEFFMRWKWYFEYRAALYKVQHPRHHVEYYTGSFKYVPPREKLIKMYSDKIAGKKRNITRMQNILEAARQDWNGKYHGQLFVDERDAFDNHPKAVKYKQKIDMAKVELKASELEFTNL